MATTRIISMHIHSGRTAGQCYQRALRYVTNPRKTRDGELVRAYGCNPETAAEEWELSRTLYQMNTGRDPQNEVLMYQVRQSFKPGEITPEEANQVGYEFASRFLKGNHAFVVCTHIDKEHIHNHIVWNAIALDCNGKWRDFYRSARAVRDLSDLICVEHSLSVITEPGNISRPYNKWLGERAEPSHRSMVRMAIDDALEQAPASMDELYTQLEQQGYIIDQSGQDTTITHPTFKRPIRFDSLGEDYTVADLRDVIAGTKEHTSREQDQYLEYYEDEPEESLDVDEAELSDDVEQYTEPQDTDQASPDESHQEEKASQSRNRAPRPPKPRRTDTPQAVINIQDKLAEGKGEGYRIWASRQNIKRIAKTKLYLDAHHLTYDDLIRQQETLSARVKSLDAEVKQVQAQIDSLSDLKRQIVNYAKTSEVFSQYKEAKYSKAFYESHKEDIDLHYAAKAVFNQFPAGTKLTVKEQQDAITALQQKRKKLYSELARTRKEERELLIHKSNIMALQTLDQPIDMSQSLRKSVDPER